MVGKFLFYVVSKYIIKGSILKFVYTFVLSMLKNVCQPLHTDFIEVVISIVLACFDISLMVLVALDESI